MRRKSKKNLPLLKILIIAAIFILLFIFLLFRLHFFNIQKIEITGSDLSCAGQEKIVDSSQILGKNFFTVNTKELTASIIRKFICIKNVTLFKIFPNKIRIEVITRSPQVKLITLKNFESSSSSSLLENVATPAAEQSLDTYLVDKDGVFFAKGSSGLDIPAVFIYNANISLGKKLENGTAENSLKILDKLNLFGLNVKSSLILDNFFIIYTSPKIIFRLDGDIDAQIASLQLILRKAKIDSSQVEFIDLRFDKPIIKIAPKKNG